MLDSILGVIEQIEPSAQRLGPLKDVVAMVGAIILAGGTILSLLLGKKRLMPPFDPEMKKLFGIILGVASGLAVAGLYWVNGARAPGPDLWPLAMLALLAGVAGAVLYAVAHWSLVFRPQTVAVGPTIAGLWPRWEARKVMRGEFDGLPEERQIPTGQIPTNARAYFDRAGGDAEFIWSRPALILSRLLLGALFAAMTLGFVTALSAVALELTELEYEVVEEPGIRVVILPGDILFAYNSAELPAQAPAVLEQVISVIDETNPTRIEVIGHTDGIGGDAFNQDLSERRAQAVADWLVTNGLPEGLPVTVIGKGETDPLFRETDDAGHDLPEARQRNRRVEIVMFHGGRASN